MTKANKKTSAVKIVDGKLILSLPDAKEPVVWQMDLEQAQSASFTVKEDKKAKAFNLVFKTQGEKQEEIAPFADKQDAINVLMETSEALQNAQGKIHTRANTSAPAGSAPNNEKGGKLGAFLAAALIIILFITWAAFSSAPSKLTGMSSAGGNSYNTDTGNPREAAGVPISADDFLSNR